MPGSWSFIVNPVAGHHSDAAVAAAVAALRDRGDRVEIFPTAAAGDATRYARELSSRSEHPALVIAGGDGTINEVLNGLPRGRGTIGLLPTGTANVLALELGITSMRLAVEKLAGRTARDLAVGRIEYAGGERYFTLMAGAGFDGAVVREVRASEKRRLGKVAYLLAACRVLARWDRGMLTVSADGGKEEHCHSVIVCNAARYGGNFLLAPGASVFVPGFTAIGIRSPKRGVLLRVALDISAGRVASCRHLAVTTARQVTIRGAKDVQVDGDYCCSGPVTIKSVEKYVRIMV